MKRILIVAAGALVGAACLFYFLKQDSVTSFAQIITQTAPPATTVPLQGAVLPPKPALLSSEEPGSTGAIVAEPNPESGSPEQDAPATTTPVPITPEAEAAQPTTPEASPAETPAEKSITPEPVAPEPIVAAPAIEEPAVPATVAESLQAHPGGLGIPVAGIAPNQLIDTFNDKRGADGSHEAIDIMAPLKTPVVAVDDGKVVKLFNSVPGGLTVYQFDPSEKFAYYYAHLDSYAPGIVEGKDLKRGDLVGYVGVTGNADSLAPHLHFAVFELGPEKHWWKGTAINPYPLFKR